MDIWTMKNEMGFKLYTKNKQKYYKGIFATGEFDGLYDYRVGLLTVTVKPEYKPAQTPIVSITTIDDAVWSAITTKDVKVDIDNLVKEWNARFGLQLPSEVELNKFLDLYYIYGENTE